MNKEKPLKNLGLMGETAVKSFLQKHKYDVLASNVRVYIGKQIGEIDIMALKNNTLYLIEVRATDKSEDEEWAKTDILPWQKREKVMKTRNIIQAITSMASGRSEVGEMDEAGDLEIAKLLLDSAEDREVEFRKELLFGVQRIRTVFAKVRIQPENKCDIDFEPLNAAYY